MSTVTLTIGLPSSGKSYWACNQQVADHSIVLVNKDDLRALLHGGVYSPKNEAQICRIRDRIIEDAIGDDRDIIVHDTNLNPYHVKRITDIVNDCQALLYSVVVRIQDFRDVPLETCIERDAERSGVGHVGESVIRGMAAKWL